MISIENALKMLVGDILVDLGLILQKNSCWLALYSLFSNVMCSFFSLLQTLHVWTGKCVLYLKALGSCNQLQNNRNNNEFNLDLHTLMLMRGTISRGLLRWKLEMHMTFEDRL